MRIVWSVEALDDLEALRAFIGGDSPKAARDMALRIIAAVEAIALAMGAKLMNSALNGCPTPRY
jgi:plasmid stabilization system protein ParE